MKILQEDGRLSNAELAERVSLSASPCWKRLKRLESSGVIRGYQAVLDRRALGMGVVAFVSISLENHTEDLPGLRGQRPRHARGHGLPQHHGPA